MHALTQHSPMLVPVLATLILLGYATSLWWLLRRESAMTLVWLVVLCSLSLLLRLIFTKNFPPGLCGDEPQYLAWSARAAQNGMLFAEAGGPPALLIALFEVPLIAVFGPGQWAIRSYSLMTSVLAVPAAFALARGMRLRVAPSFAAAAFLAVLPWSLFYGRISMGGELTFHQLLLLAALARLVWALGGWAEVGIGSLGFCLLLYDYGCGRAMVGMALVGAVLARGWRRVGCLAIVLVAFIGWIPHLRTHPASAAVGFSAAGFHPGFREHPLETLQARTLRALQTLTAPIGIDAVYTVRAAAIHPPLVLALAALGSLTGIRRGLFLWGGFLGGLTPAVFSCCADDMSAHRMLMAFPFIALAAACTLNFPGPRVLRRMVAVIVVLIVGAQSVSLYFSSTFWPPESAGVFDPDRTALAEALPPRHPRVIAMRQMEPYFELFPKWEPLTVENWIPTNQPSVYAFTGVSAALRPFYEGLFGAERVRVFGHAFMVTLEAGDWSWLRQHGWTYEAHCGERVWTGQVPTLAHSHLTLDAVYCPGGPVTHVWRGRWEGPPSTLRLWFEGAATVDTAQGRVVEQTSPGATAEFAVEPNSPVTVTIIGQAWINTALVEVTPAGGRVPAWERVSPILAKPSS